MEGGRTPGTTDPAHTPGPTNARPAWPISTTAHFQVPELPTIHLHRPQLLETLCTADHRPLVLVSAPAGTGKTTLVSEWVRTRMSPETTGWITFEDGDFDFWGIVWGCLARLGVAVPARHPDAADNGPGTPLLTALAQSIIDTPRPMTLVLDGNQMISRDLAHDVDYLLRHTMGRLCLVVLGRDDPALPLYRYRLTESVLEIRAADLAFTDLEAYRLLSRTGVTLTTTSVRDLNERLRGWVAGLRFVALSLIVRPDPEPSLTSVVSRSSDITDYLVEEVLNTHPPQVRRFLLDTSVPELLWPGLAVELGGSDAVRILGDLSRSNAFIEVPPDRPGCYRYHPFFRDLLRSRLASESPQRSAELHRRTVAWLHHNRPGDRSRPLPARFERWHDAAGPPVDRAPAQATPDRERQTDGVVEALTGKEREVLGHLEALLTTQEIAEKMYVSVNTVRTHVRSILRKLGVSRRNAAVRKARTLGLVGGIQSARDPYSSHPPRSPTALA